MSKSIAAQLSAHKKCRAGICGECRGLGDSGCECLECSHNHTRKCDHCEGSGECSVDGDELRKAAKNARAEWDEFLGRYVFQPTRTAFCLNWKAMYFSDPPESAINDFVTLTQRLADDAGVDWKADR